MAKITSKQINVIDTVNFNGNAIENALINAANNTITGLQIGDINNLNVTLQGMATEISGLSNIAATLETQVITDSGKTLPATTGYVVGDTFLNTTDNKLYTVLPVYELNTDVTNQVTVDFMAGTASGFTSVQDRGPQSISRIVDNNLAWIGNKSYQVTFKLDSLAKGCLIGINSNGVTGTVYYNVFYIDEDYKIYYHKIRTETGYAYDSVKTLALDYELQANVKYTLNINKQGNSLFVELVSNGQVLISNIIETTDWVVTASKVTYKIVYGVFSIILATFQASYILTTGQIYLLESSGEFLTPSSTLSWDNGTPLEDNKQYADTKNAILYFYKANTLFTNTGSGAALNFEQAGITKITSSDTMVDLAQEIESKGFATGTMLFGEIENSDMPFNGNAEVRVDILDTKDDDDQVILFTLYSTNVAPYEWEWRYYLSDTVTWIPKAIPTNDYTSNSENTVPTSYALDAAISNINGIIATKQDNLTFDNIPTTNSINPVTSEGIKSFVNSSIATNTANFIGTFNSVSELNAYSGTITNNDYAFVTNSVVTNNGADWTNFNTLNAYNKALLTEFDYAWVVNGSNFDLYRFNIVNQTWNARATNIAKADVTLNSAFNRYKYNGDTQEWLYEYTLNNTDFTTVQWAAINSGITSSKVTAYDNHIINTSNPHNVTKSQIGLSKVNNTSDLSKPISTATQNALNAKQDILTAGTGITIENNVISATGGVGTTTYWGQIEGNITDQQDLNSIITELNTAIDTIPTIPVIETDNQLIAESYNLVPNKVITEGIDNAKITTVSGIVDTLPQAQTLNNKVVLTTDNKIYETVYAKQISSQYTVNGELSIDSDGIITGFNVGNYEGSHNNSLQITSGWWSYLTPLKLQFKCNMNYAAIAPNVTIFKIVSADKVLFDIHFKYEIANEGRTFIISNYNNSGEVLETASYTFNNLGIKFNKDYIFTFELLPKGQTGGNDVVLSFNGTTVINQHFTFKNVGSGGFPPNSGTVTIMAEMSSNGINGITHLYGLQSYISSGSYGPRNKYPVAIENENSLVWDAGTSLVKDKIVLDLPADKLYEFNGTTLNQIIKVPTEPTIVNLTTTTPTTNVVIDANNTYTLVCDNSITGLNITLNNPTNTNINNSALLHCYIDNENTAIDWGTDKFFNDEQPSIDSKGCYDVIYVWNNLLGKYVCKTIFITENPVTPIYQKFNIFSSFDNSVLETPEHSGNIVISYQNRQLSSLEQNSVAGYNITNVEYTGNDMVAVSAYSVNNENLVFDFSYPEGAYPMENVQFNLNGYTAKIENYNAMLTGATDSTTGLAISETNVFVQPQMVIMKQDNTPITGVHFGDYEQAWFLEETNAFITHSGTLEYIPYFQAESYYPVSGCYKGTIFELNQMVADNQLYKMVVEDNTLTLETVVTGQTYTDTSITTEAKYVNCSWSNAAGSNYYFIDSYDVPTVSIENSVIQFNIAADAEDFNLTSGSQSEETSCKIRNCNIILAVDTSLINNNINMYIGGNTSIENCNIMINDPMWNADVLTISAAGNVRMENVMIYTANGHTVPHLYLAMSGQGHGQLALINSYVNGIINIGSNSYNSACIYNTRIGENNTLITLENYNSLLDMDGGDELNITLNINGHNVLQISE